MGEPQDAEAAEFIAAPFPLDPETAAPHFRREFTVHREPDRATLHATALGIVEPHLNGTRVGDEVLAPGWTSYRHRVPVSAHDVTGLIRRGPNALGAVVGEGWAAGRLGWSANGEADRHHYTDRPALYLRLELTFGDRTEVIGTDGSFTCATGAVVAHSLYDGEAHDARLEPDGWDLPGFDDGAWSRAVPFAWDERTLIPRTAPPIRRIEELAPVAVSTSPSGRTIVDFGQNIAGRIRLTVTGEAGRTVTVRHAETLLPDGELDVRSLRSAKATDRYTPRGGGEPETWEPRFTVHGFRYAEVDGPFDDVTAVVLHSDMPRTGRFETSDERVNRLHANTVRSMRGNFVGLPTDCPQRDERMGWTGDINVFAPTAAFLYDVRGVLGSWLDDLAAEQRERGVVPFTVPDVLPHPSSPTALWGDVAVGLPWTLYRAYGDLEILRRAYGSMTAFVRDVESRLDGDGLWSSGFQFGDWLDPDAPADDSAGAKTDRFLVANAYLCRTTRQLAETARLLGRDADATRFAALDERVRAAFRREYVSPNGRVTGETATAYALAIVFDVLDPEQERRAGDRLAGLVADAGYTISTGFAGTPHVLPALTRTGHLDDAYRLLLQTSCPSWLYPITMGATTVWERWDAVRPDGTLNPSTMCSLNHYAFGAVAEWLHTTVGGLSPVEPGYRTMRIAPRPGGGLTGASLAHRTPHGEVRVSWRLTEAGRHGRMAVEVTVPDGTAATVVLPHHPDGLVAEVAGGDHAWSYEPPEGLLPGTAHDLDTPLRALLADRAVRAALEEAFARHFPDVPFKQVARRLGEEPMRTVLERIPDAAGDARADLAAAALGRR
ncbi:alpha-L-rhamnosidase [Actinomadura sp. WMMB 499]|uniref:alpha-L-rhamnosidase n=1 Tax=Actinomadura sp. WMMB 499 TaxID=1219491 RepID=UPI001C3F739D|nr:alpha-L-rhamnosidase [Actinomadura sp. WMMB 499]